MRAYGYTVSITGFIAAITAVITIVLHYFCEGNEASFWRNVSLTIFGGAIITFITSVIGYKNERIRALESFSSATKKILYKIREYDADWELEKKIKFFEDMAAIDLFDYGACYAKIWLFNKEAQKKIHETIYWPIHSFCDNVQKTVKNLPGKEPPVKASEVDTLELQFTRILTPGSPNIGSIICAYLFYHTIDALNSWYYDFMYPWKAHEEEKRTEKYKEKVRTRKRILICLCVMAVLFILLFGLVFISQNSICI